GPRGQWAGRGHRTCHVLPSSRDRHESSSFWDPSLSSLTVLDRRIDTSLLAQGGHGWREMSCGVVATSTTQLPSHARLLYLAYHRRGNLLLSNIHTPPVNAVRRLTSMPSKVGFRKVRKPWLRKKCRRQK